MKMINMKNRKKQKGSFALEAALICLVLACAGMTFYFGGTGMIGEYGECVPTLSGEGTIDVTYSTESTGASGIAGMMAAIDCKLGIVNGKLFSGTTQDWAFQSTIHTLP